MAKEKMSDKSRAKQRPARPVNTSQSTSRVPSKKSKRKQRPPRAIRLSQAERYMQPARPERIGVSVTLNVPRMPRVEKAFRWLRVFQVFRPKNHPRLAAKLAALPSVPRRLRRPVSFAIVLVAVAMLAFGVRSSQHKPTIDVGKGNGVVRTAPDFKPLVPSSAEASATTYDGRRNMISYSTTFSGTRMTVSQQPLPARFKTDRAALQSAADSIHAQQHLDTAKGPIYIATNETKDQLAVYAGPEVLLFIHTDRKLDDASWKAFIELLRPK